ncbi:hypothetical protein HYH03_012607 [Edaphochlamys debaryana]|uniref:phytol kinase n=1 Tax=Edaphochlamys debaryana TaxID=47281 RepID=A0A835XPP0_9CHLO|nr:hypothetical protein HYH03_012607 [Edaphochlamys debaryana]|eukprot:KAG2488807.1 hypothetical protein HYH03_012607 [Edaphochlamys debaryana]
MIQERGKQGSVARPLDASELEDMLQALVEHITSTGQKAAAQLLADEPFLVGILQLAAFGYRPQPARAGEHAAAQLRRDFCFKICELVSTLLGSHTAGTPAEQAGQRRLARGLLQTQAIPAAASQLASLTKGLQGSAGAPSSAACLDAFRYLEVVVSLPLSLLSGPSEADLTSDVAVALVETGLMEHAGRSLQVIADSGLKARRARVIPLPLIPTPSSSLSIPAAQLLLALQGACTPAQAHLMADAQFGFACAYNSTAEVARRVSFTSAPLQVLSGPCARHAAVAVGLATLGELKGAEEGRIGALCPCQARGGQHQRGPQLHMRLRALNCALQPTLPAPPRPITAARLLLRLGFAVAGSEGQPGGVGAAGTAGAGGSGGGSRDRAQLFPELTDAGIAALSALTQHLCARERWRGPWPAVAVDAWRLAAALLTRPGAGVEGGEEQRSAGGTALVGLLATCTADADCLCFSSEPPPSVAAALAGGALPLLEGLLRRAGEAPELLEAGILYRVKPGPKWGATLPLLGYGEPLQGAAFVTTSTKLLRRASARGPPTGAPETLSRLALVLSLALPEWLTELSRPALQGAAQDEAAWREESGQQGSAEQRSKDGGAAANKLQALYFTFSALSVATHVLSSHIPAAATAEASAGVRSWEDAGATHCSAAACSGGGGGPKGSGSSGLSGSGSSGPGGSGSDSRPGGSELLYPPGAPAEVELVGAALGLLIRRTPDAKAWKCLYRNVGLAAVRLAARRPCEVRALTASGSPNAWRPEAVRMVAEAVGRVADDIRARKPLEWTTDAHYSDTLARHLGPLAAQLEAWAAGEEGVGAGRWSEAWAEVEACLDKDTVRWALAPLLVPPAEARRRLDLPPVCANPACANLAGDSEAGLRLQQCGRCGRVSYCCRECQMAHWRAGHKAECSGGKAG